MAGPGVDPPQPVERRRAAVPAPKNGRIWRSMSSAHALPSPGELPNASARATCMPGGGLPQPAGLGREVATGLGRVGRAAVGGGALGSITGIDWVSKIAEQVPQRRQGQRPPLDRAGEERLQQGEVEPGRRLGAQRRRDPREADPAERRR